MKNILLLFCYFIKIMCFNIPHIGSNNIVILHLEKFNDKYNLLHIGISFIDDKNKIRFDFRPSNNGKSYITNIIKINTMNEYSSMNNISNSNISNTNSLIDYLDNIDNPKKKNIFWGITEKTQEEILEFEKNKLIKKKYIIGLYDCRHYVNDYSLWCLEKPTPIWSLYKLWEDN